MHIQLRSIDFILLFVRWEKIYDHSRKFQIFLFTIEFKLCSRQQINHVSVIEFNLVVIFVLSVVDLLICQPEAEVMPWIVDNIQLFNEGVEYFLFLLIQSIWILLRF